MSVQPRGSGEAGAYEKPIHDYQIKENGLIEVNGETYRVKVQTQSGAEATLSKNQVEKLLDHPEISLAKVIIPKETSLIRTRGIEIEQFGITPVDFANDQAARKAEGQMEKISDSVTTSSVSEDNPLLERVSVWTHSAIEALESIRDVFKKAWISLSSPVETAKRVYNWAVTESDIAPQHQRHSMSVSGETINVIEFEHIPSQKDAEALQTLENEEATEAESYNWSALPLKDLAKIWKEVAEGDNKKPKVREGVFRSGSRTKLPGRTGSSPSAAIIMRETLEKIKSAQENEGEAQDVATLNILFDSIQNSEWASKVFTHHPDLKSAFERLSTDRLELPEEGEVSLMFEEEEELVAPEFESVFDEPAPFDAPALQISLREAAQILNMTPTEEAMENQKLRLDSSGIPYLTSRKGTYENKVGTNQEGHDAAKKVLNMITGELDSINSVLVDFKGRLSATQINLIKEKVRLLGEALSRLGGWTWFQSVTDNSETVKTHFVTTQKTFDALDAELKKFPS